jgi:Domain of unknown function (DUF4920)
MLKKITALIILTLFAGGVQAKNYGGTMQAGEAVDIAVAAQSVETYAGKPTKFKGRITQVCQMLGCWLMIESNGQAARIQMKDEAFVIPKDAKGEAVVLGEIRRVELQPAAAKRSAKDNGKSALAATSELQITATSISIEE